jgi:4-oxalocrotonate tautomerase
VVDNLAVDPGVRPEDVFINRVEVLPENWSFGNGVAQYATDSADRLVSNKGTGPW